MSEKSQDEIRDEANKLDGWANIIAAGGSAVGTIGGLFGRGPNTPGVTQPTVIEKDEANKAKTNQLLMYGGGALLLIVILLMLKK